MYRFLQFLGLFVLMLKRPVLGLIMLAKIEAEAVEAEHSQP